MNKRSILHFLAFLIFGGALSVLDGQDISFDLKNYHFYNAYALLHNRYNYDINAAQIQTYLNPILDIPYYLLVTIIKSGILVTFLMGFWYGLFSWATFKLFSTIYPIENNKAAISIAILLGISGVSAVGQIGMTSNDVLTAAILMCAILACVKGFLRIQTFHYSFWYFALSGLLCGLAVGAKLSAAVFGLSLFLAFSITILLKRPDRLVLLLGIFIITGVLGFLITGGFWHYYLWQEFQNPFFPFFNGYFKSPFIETGKLEVSSFRVFTISKLLSLPWLIADKNTSLVTEGTMADPRLLIGYLSIIVIILTVLFRKFKQPSNFPSSSFLPPYVIIFFIFLWISGYGLWAYLHGIHRYMVILEPLSIALLLIAIEMFKPSSKILLVALATIFITTYSATRYISWGRLRDYGIYTLNVQPPSIEKDSLVVMLSGKPLSYVVPFFNPQVKFVYPRNNIMYPYKTNLIQLKAKDTINLWEGPMYALTPNGYNFFDDEALPYFHLEVDYAGENAGCRPIISNIEMKTLQLCKLKRG